MEYVILIICLMGAGFAALYLVFKRIISRWFVNTAELDKIKAEVEKMLVELNHTTGRNIDLIEARVTQLRELLATVDKRIGLYKREADKTETAKTVYSSIVKNRPAQTTPVEKKGTEVITTISLRDKVLNLYHAGFTTAMIANQLQSTIGEVELIISLAENE
jgi:hypothetical protein